MGKFKGGMKMTRFSDKTIAAAIATGLETLGVSRENVQIAVIQKHKRGFLGIGRKLAIVDLTVNPQLLEQKKKPAKDRVKLSKETPQLKQDSPQVMLKQAKKQQVRDAVIAAQYYLIDIIEKMGVAVTVQVDYTNKEAKYVLITTQEGRLIGKRGRTLNALQVLVQNYLEKKGAARVRVVLDVGNYRKRRRQTLERLAENVALEAIVEHKKIALDTMPAFERKIVHTKLAHNEKIVTYSRGKEPQRYVVVDAENKQRKF